jgi:hypothetical protein
MNEINYSPLHYVILLQLPVSLSVFSTLLLDVFIVRNMNNSFPEICRPPKDWNKPLTAALSYLYYITLE